jgi:Undecaprenyl-phosphate galactose phosphotransferase WbaP
MMHISMNSEALASDVDRIVSCGEQSADSPVLKSPKVDPDSVFHECRWIGLIKLMVDVAALELALLVGFRVREFLLPWWPIPFGINQYWDLAAGVLLVPCGFWLQRLYPGYGLTGVERLRRRVRATSALFLVLIVWQFLVHGTWSRGVYLMTFGFALTFPPLLQCIVRNILIRMNLWGTPVLILGAATTGRMLVSTLNRDRALGLRPVALLDDDPKKWGAEIDGVPVIGGTKLAYRYEGKLRYAMIAMPGAGRKLIASLAKNLPFPHIMLIPDLFGLQSLWIDARDISGVLSLEMKKNLLLRRYWVAKRLLDYILGVPLFLLSLPVIAISAALIKLVSRGPAFYAQEREGLAGKRIKVWKLRTMYPDAELLLRRHLAENPEAKAEWERFFKLKNDPRILPVVGTLLRRTSLDELPQLWNVLCGEMSLVGPRPFPHYHLEKFDDEFRFMRRNVLPGVTGYWQVSARSDGDLRIQESLDTYYIRNWSIWLDLSLLGRTIQVVLNGKGAY